MGSDNLDNSRLLAAVERIPAGAETADHVIDLGLEAARNGGKLIICGTPMNCFLPDLSQRPGSRREIAFALRPNLPNS